MKNEKTLILALLAAAAFVYGCATTDSNVQQNCQPTGSANAMTFQEKGPAGYVNPFADPAAEFTRGIEKRLLHYEREDGVPMSGTLYLPPGTKAGAKLPVLVWAYPLEYTQASDAGQVRASPTSTCGSVGPRICSCCWRATRCSTMRRCRLSAL